MKRQVFATVVAFFVVFLLGGAQAFAQPVKVNIGFPFVANGIQLPAGTYTMEGSSSSMTVTLRGATGSPVVMPVVTFLGRHDKDPEPEVVFDKIDGKLILSEIWGPGQDGLQVSTTKQKHEHAVVGGSNPRP
jgi:hypothetical protein